MKKLQDHAKAFVLTHFENITQIEILCFLFKNRDAKFSSEKIAELLFLNTTLVAHVLTKFQLLKFVLEREGQFQFNSGCYTEDLHCIDSVACSFEENRKLFVNLFYDAFMDRK